MKGCVEVEVEVERLQVFKEDVHKEGTHEWDGHLKCNE